MNYRKLLTPVIVTALLILAFAFVLVQLWGTPLRTLINGFFVLAIYGLLIISYLVRIGFIFFGVFAVYRLLIEHVNGQDYKQMGV